jgi:enoyl-CoA hydratase/carnithine racemase
MSALGTGGLTVETQDGVAVVTLDRPQRRNALTAALMTAIGGTMASLDADESVGAIILTGRDPAFCAGLDLSELSTSGDNLHIDQTGRPWPRLSTPVIGAVNGPAVTGGLELVLHCDFAVASERAAFADTHARVGVLPSWGLSVLLPQAVGLRRAKQMSLTGNFVQAEVALQWGLVNLVVGHAELLAAATQLARDVCSNDGAAVAALLTLYDDNAADQTSTGQQREWHLAREWRDRMYRPEHVAARQEAIRERGRNQLPGSG